MALCAHVCSVTLNRGRILRYRPGPRLPHAVWHAAYRCLVSVSDISINGDTAVAFTKNVEGRFSAYGWQILRVDDGVWYV